MAVQTQVTNLAAIFGNRISAANELAKDKPLDKGFQGLPPGMKNAVAHLQVMEIGQNKDDKKGPGMTGKHYFRASAVTKFSGNVLTPHEHRGVRVLNIQTSQFVDLCDMQEVPARDGNPARPAVSFEQNWEQFVNYFKMFGIVCPETKTSDPSGQKTWMFYMAAMKELTDPAKPRYVSFSTSESWKRRRANETLEAFNQREGRIFETWHEGVDWKGIVNPTESVNLVTTPVVPVANGVGNGQPHPLDHPPHMAPDGLPITPNYGEISVADQVSALLKLAYDENEEAQNTLNEMAMANGWTEEEVMSGDVTWGEVAEMAIAPPAEDSQQIPTVGSKWNFCKRDKNGAKLVDEKGAELPSQEIEIVTVDEATSTCTAKSVKGGRHLTDVRTRKPISIKFEWLE